MKPSEQLAISSTDALFDFIEAQLKDPRVACVRVELTLEGLAAFNYKDQVKRRFMCLEESCPGNPPSLHIVPSRSDTGTPRHSFTLLFGDHGDGFLHGAPNTTVPYEIDRDVPKGSVGVFEHSIHDPSDEYMERETEADWVAAWKAWNPKLPPRVADKSE